jgi:hypothetical protein
MRPVAFAERASSASVPAPINDPVRGGGRRVVEALNEAGAEARPEAPFRRLPRVGLDWPGADFELVIWSAPSSPSYDLSSCAIFGSNFAQLGGYRSGRFDDLAARIDEAPSEGERREAVGAALAQLAEDAPVVPLVYPRGAYAYTPESYDGWIYVNGEGILDKRSFLADDPARAEAAGAGRQPARPEESGVGDWSGSWPLAVVALGGFAGYTLAGRAEPGGLFAGGACR